MSLAIAALALFLATLVLLFGVAALIAARRVAAFGAAHPPRGDFITVDGVRLHYRRTGDPAAPATLILHGASSNLEEPHLALAETLADEHVIWVDRPGLGWSDRPAGHWTPEREAALLAAFLTALDVERAVIVGHSWGGAIAMRMAIDHPARLDGLVLVAPALSAWIGEAAWFNAASFSPVIGPLLYRVAVPLAGRSQAGAGAAKAFHPEPLPENYVARTGLLLLLRPETWLANAADMRFVNQHLAAQQDRYGEVELPVIMIAGKPDTVLWSERHAGDVSERLKNAELRWIKRAGHNLHHHHPRAVLRAIHDVRDPARRLPKRVTIAGSPA